jgi:ubiquinol-cytochrome c reductase iron-sulfur subunit
VSAVTRAVVAFVVATAAAVGLGVAYVTDASARWQGLALALMLGGLAVGFVTWANHLMPQGPVSEARVTTEDTSADEVEASFDAGADAISRRTLLVRAVTLAGAAAAAVALFPLRSLGPRPGKALARTPWRRGVRAITEDGRAVLAADVPADSLVTIFPDGHPLSPDGQALLLRVGDRLVAYSRICTHAGCPVGLYDAERHQLICPCHQSAFDARDGARPVFGPAAVALPELPVRVDDDGVVVALGDFSAPVGPAYWRKD